MKRLQSDGSPIAEEALQANAPCHAPAIWRARVPWRLAAAAGLVLRRPVAGFVSAVDTEGAVACEIAISRKVAALGFRIGLLQPGKAFSMIGHPQWTWAGHQVLLLHRLKARLLRSLRFR